MLNLFETNADDLRAAFDLMEYEGFYDDSRAFRENHCTIGFTPTREHFVCKIMIRHFQ